MSLLGERFHSFLCFPPLFLFRVRFLTEHNFVSDFADWVEFSPYEIGMAKYGTFMSPDLFGSKFFMGTVVKKYNENPLHFLMGEYVIESFKNKSNFSSSWTFKFSHRKCETRSGALSFLEDIHLKDFTDMNRHCLFVSYFHGFSFSFGHLSL